MENICDSQELLSHYSVQIKDLLLKLNRIEVQTIIAFTTGHIRFNAHLKKINIKSDSKCKFCEAHEMAKHIMCDCDAYAALRQRFTGTMYCELK